MNTACVTIRVAAIPVTMESGPALAEMLRKRYAPFLTDTPGLYRARLDWEKSAGAGGMPDPSMVFQPGELSFAEPGFSGQVNWHAGAASAQIAARLPLGYVDYFLRMIYALLVFEQKGIMLHSAGIVHRERAHLFFGHSGSGKTTVSRLSISDVVLNDDLVILLPEGPGWRVYATPFWNPTQVRPTDQHAPLAGLYRLVQDQRVFLETMPPAQALAELLTSVPVIPADRWRNASLLERCFSLASSAPVFRMHFLPDASFWAVIDAQ